MFHRLTAIVLSVFLSAGITACAPTAQNTAQSLAEEQRAAEGLVRDLDAKGKLMKDRRINNYVNAVVARIAKERPPGAVPLKSYVIKDADVNAFTTGGGYVFFNTGLLAAMENEAQFATVTAHEIAHIDRGHVQAGKASRQGVQLGALVAMIGGAALGVDPRLTEQVVGLGANLAVNSFTRTQERDADDTGVRYLASAGYNANEGAKSFGVLRRLYGDKTGPAAAFFSSHPASSEREATLTSMAKQLGATKGRIGDNTHDRATRSLRRDVLKIYESEGRDREAAQVRKELR